MLRTPQLAQVPNAVVISWPKTPIVVPAIPFPSNSIDLHSRRTEGHVEHPARLVAKGDQTERGFVDEWRRSAHVDERALARRPGDLLKKLHVGPSLPPPPSLRLLPREREPDVDRVAENVCHQLVAIPHRRPHARR